MFYLGFQKSSLRVWSCPYIVTMMTLNLLHVGELCAVVPLLYCLDVKELPSPALVSAMVLGFSVVPHELFSAVGSDGLPFQQ